MQDHFHPAVTVWRERAATFQSRISAERNFALSCEFRLPQYQISPSTEKQDRL